MPFDQRAERNTPRYKRARKRFLRENPLCAECERQGVIRPADELDHIIPIAERPDLFWDFDGNIQGLCRPHHESKTARENRRMTEARERKEARFERVRAALKGGEKDIE